MMRAAACGTCAAGSATSVGTLEEMVQDETELMRSEFDVNCKGDVRRKESDGIGAKRRPQRRHIAPTSMEDIAQNFPGVREVNALIGRGSFSQLFSCTVDDSSEQVALKVWHPGQQIQQSREADLLMRLQHPNLIRLHKFVAGPPAGLLLELCEGGDLHSLLHFNGNKVHLKFVGLPERARAGLDVARAVEYLHANGVVHRDIKSLNCFLSSRVVFPLSGKDLPSVKLGDLGFARAVSQGGHMTCLVGTYAYMAPEVMTEDEGSYSFPVDMYSLAILMHELITGQEPYAEESGSITSAGLMVAIASGRRPPLTGFTKYAASGALRSLITSCWQGDPGGRPTAEEAVQQLMAIKWAT